MVNETNFKKWITALRSGEYEQGVGYLFNEGRYCCLGVGCRVAGVHFGPMQALPTREFIDWLGIPLTEKRQRQDTQVPPILAESNVLTYVISIDDHPQVPLSVVNLNDGAEFINSERDPIKSIPFDQIADWLELNKDELVAM